VFALRENTLEFRQWTRYFQVESVLYSARSPARQNFPIEILLSHYRPFCNIFPFNPNLLWQYPFSQTTFYKLFCIGVISQQEVGL
jgi:hypothetical protein